MNISGSKKLLGVALSAALGLGAVGNAQAAAYAVSIDDVTRFGMTLSGDVTVSAPLVTVSQASASHAGVGPATSDPIDALQAIVGVPDPGQNFFDRNPLDGRVGDYARGDAQIRNTDVFTVDVDGFGNGSAANIAESYDVSGDLGASSASNTLASEIIVGPNGANVAFAFDASPYMELEVDQFHGGSATADLFFNITIEDQNTNVTVFDWSPDGLSFNDGTGNDVEGAMSLNENLVAHAGDPLQIHNPGSAIFSYSNNIDLTAGTYNVSVAMVEQVSTHGVPEPASLLLMGGGLVGMVYARRRKVNKA